MLYDLLKSRRSIRKFQSKELEKEKIDTIPSQYSVACMVAIGYPAEEKRAYSEDDLLCDKLHFERF